VNADATPVGLLRAFLLSLLFGLSSHILTGAEVTVTRTNLVKRWITNVIDVRMPVNHFVNQYRTNWVTQFQTNVVDVYATNWMMVKQTNQIEVAATWTNQVTAYHTNWAPRHVTNRVAVNLVRTNFVDRYHTNWSTLSLTNWQTVVLFKTNWVAQPVTNLIQIDLPTRLVATAPVPAEVVEPKESPEETVVSASATTWTGPLSIEAARTAQPPVNELVEVRMKVRWNSNSSTPLQVQHWRVEREDGAVLLFGQEQEFKRQLPVGRYKVEAKLKADGDNPPLSARGTLSVTIREAVVQPRLLVKK
jgi:hypothetical protein